MSGCKTTVYPLQENTVVDVGATPSQVSVGCTAHTVESSTQANAVSVIIPDATVLSAGVQGPPGPLLTTDVQKLEFVGKGIGATKTQTIIVGDATMAEAFGIADELYLQWVLPIGVDKSIVPVIHGSFFPTGSEVGTTVSWQIDFLADVDGGDVAAATTVRYMTDAPLPDTGNTAAHGELEFPNSDFLTATTEAVHIRIKRVASSNDPSAKVAIEHIAVQFSREV